MSAFSKSSPGQQPVQPVRWYRLTTRQLAITGMLGAISIVLGLTNLGIIPIPPLGVTILHIPVIIAAILEGPLVGMLVGLIFGGFSMYQALMSGTPLSVIFLDPAVALLPRLLIGPVTYGVYRLVKRLFDGRSNRTGEYFAIPTAAVTGTLVNTVGVLSMIYLRHLATYAQGVEIAQETVSAALVGIGIAQGLPEAGVAALITTPVVRIIQKTTRRENKSRHG